MPSIKMRLIIDVIGKRDEVWQPLHNINRNCRKVEKYNVYIINIKHKTID